MHKLRYLDHVIKASEIVDIDPEDFLQAQMHFTTKCAREEGLDQEQRIRKVQMMLEAASAYGAYLLPVPEDAALPVEPAVCDATQTETHPVQEEQPPPGIGRRLWEDMVNKFRSHE